MNTTIRNSLLAFAIVGALSLSACKTTDDSMDAPEAAPAPAEPATDSTTPPMDSGVPTDPTTTPTDPAPTTP